MHVQKENLCDGLLDWTIINTCPCAFFLYVGLPTVLGAINRTHVNIKTASGPDRIQYINRKGRPSINVEVGFNFNKKCRSKSCKKFHLTTT